MLMVEGEDADGDVNVGFRLEKSLQMHLTVNAQSGEECVLSEKVTERMPNWLEKPSHRLL